MEIDTPEVPVPETLGQALDIGARLGSLYTEARDAEVTSAQLDDLRSARDAAVEDRDNLQRDLTQARQDAANAVTRNTDNVASLQRAEEQVRTLRAQLASERQTAAERTTTLEGQVASQSARITEQSAAIANHGGQLLRHNTASKALYNGLSRRLRVLQGQFEEFRTTTTAALEARADSSGTQAQRRSRRLSAVRDLQTLSTTMLDSFKTDMDRLGTLLTDARATVSSSPESSPTRANRTLQGELESQRTLADVAQRERDEQRGRADVLQGEVDDLRGAAADHDAQRTELERRVDELSASATQHENRANRLHDAAQSIIDSSNETHRTWAAAQAARLRAANDSPASDGDDSPLIRPSRKRRRTRSQTQEGGRKDAARHRR